MASSSSLREALSSKKIGLNPLQPQSARKVPRSTDIMVTVNSLKRPTSDVESGIIQDKIIDAVDKLFRSPPDSFVNTLNKYPTRDPKTDLPDGTPRPVLMEVTNASVDTDFFSFELPRNPKTGRLHAHFIVSITHTWTEKWGSKDNQKGIRLQHLIKAFQAYFTEELDLRNKYSNTRTAVYVHIDVFHNLSKAKNYINKYQSIGQYIRNESTYEPGVTNTSRNKLPAQ